MGKAIMGSQKCLTYMIEVLNNYRFNRSVNNKSTTFEDASRFIIDIIPLGYVFMKCTRIEDNNQKNFMLLGCNCKQINIYFQGDYDNIDFFQKQSHART